MDNQVRRSRTFLALIAVILTVWALKATAAVTLPLAFALFLIALFWPLQGRLEKHMGRGPATLLTLLAFLASAAVFVGLIWFSAEEVATKLPEYRSEFQQIADQVRSWAQEKGISLGGTGSGATGGSAQDEILKVGDRLFSFLGALVLVIAFLVLGLHEVHDFEYKLQHGIRGERGQRWIEATHQIARDFQRYFGVRTLVGAITGVLTGLGAFLIGLDFALIWGLLNFLLNYIPTLGSIIAVFPPLLFALVQFDGFGMAALTLGVVGGVQLVMGNYIDPLLQGKYLRLSALVVLFSVAFWGWVWGVAGAFIGVPLTVAVVIGCNAFDRTRWIARFLADVDLTEEEEEEEKS